MHSFWQRLNAIFFYALSVLGFLSFMAAGSTYWHEDSPKIDLQLNNFMLYAQHVSRAPFPSHSICHSALPLLRRKFHGAGHDQAILSIGVDADLRSLFNWNVKQLFVYVTAEYETEENVRCVAALPGTCALPESVLRLRVCRCSTRRLCGTRSSRTRHTRGSAPPPSPISIHLPTKATA